MDSSLDNDLTQEYVFTVGNFSSQGVTLVDRQFNIIQLPRSILPTGSTSGSIIKMILKRDFQQQKKKLSEFSQLLSKLQKNQNHGQMIISDRDQQYVNIQQKNQQKQKTNFKKENQVQYRKQQTKLIKINQKQQPKMQKKSSNKETNKQAINSQNQKINNQQKYKANQTKDKNNGVKSMEKVKVQNIKQTDTSYEQKQKRNQVSPNNQIKKEQKQQKKQQQTQQQKKQQQIQQQKQTKKLASKNKDTTQDKSFSKQKVFKKRSTSSGIQKKTIQEAQIQ